MKSIFIYPPSLEKYHVRLGAFFVFIFSVVAIVLSYFQSPLAFFITLILWTDFFICSSISPKYSIFKPLINPLYKKLIAKEFWIPSKPKRFAKFCGFFMLSLSIILYFIDTNYFLILLGILSLFSFLEAIFDFCVACKMYSIGQKIGLIPKDSCENC